MAHKTEMTDCQIQQAVLRELAWDTRVRVAEIGVAVERGVVTLAGTVESWAKRVAAQQAAHRVPCVLDVVNEIDVRIAGSEGLSDAELAHAVFRALEWHVLVPHGRILTTVSKGWVTLEGTVETWSQHEDAELAVRALPGVVRVTNVIKVVPPAVAGSELRKSIEAALERRAEQEPSQLDLDIHDGRVVLSGIVSSWSEKQAIVGTVKGTFGVGAVDDHLQVSSL